VVWSLSTLSTTDGFSTSSDRAQSIDESVDQGDHVDGTRYEVVEFTASRIDHFFPWFEFDAMQGQLRDAIGERSVRSEVSHEASQGRCTRGHVGMFAADPLDVFRGESDDQIGGLDVLTGDLLAAMLTGLQAHALESFSRAPTDGLTVDAESSGRHHVEAWFAVDESGAGHHRTRGITCADDEK
jgi:hypothetical protein